MHRRPAFAALAVLLGVGATAAITEIAVRVGHPTPRVQVIRLDVPTIRSVEQDGVTLPWEPAAGDLARGGPCRRGQPVVGIVGDSILMVVGAANGLPRTADVLRERLAADHVDACVLDTSWPGWKPVQELAMLRRLHAEHPLDVAVFGVWKIDQRYVRAGDVLIDGEVVVHDADGFPLPPLPIPRAAHRWLLGASTAWRYATLALDPPAPLPRPPDAAYRDALAWSAQTGVPMVMVEGVFMDKPFAASIAERAATPDAWQVRLAADAEAQGVRSLWLGDVFRDLDPEAIRLDTCCHFDVDGHAAAGAALAPLVEEALRARAPGATPPDVAVTSPGTAPR